MKKLYILCFIIIFLGIISLIFYHKNTKIQKSLPYKFILKTDSENLEKFTFGQLENGVKYYILNNSKPKKRASINLVVNVGSLMEDDNQKGIAHFLEHMAFNGTQNYPKNDLIKHLETLGLSFGGDLNAYTGFLETVYKLKIPTNEPSSISESFHILKEWATNISFKEEDVINERNIILEEWRGRQGLRERISFFKRNILFGDSKFFHRMPIGDTEIIKNTDSDLLKEFYHKWYQPKNFLIIAIGDFNIKDIEEKIKSEFSSIENSISGISEEHSLESLKESYSIFSDSELTNTTLEYSVVNNISSISNFSELKKSIVQTLYFNILNSRLDLLANKNNSPLISSGIYSSRLGKHNEIISLTSQVKENNILQANKLIYQNLNILSTFGPYLSELNNEKSELYTQIQSQNTNRKSLDNESFFNEIKDWYMYGDVLLFPKDKLNLLDEVFPTITVADIQEYAKNYYEKDKALFLTSNNKDNLPSKEELKDTNYKIKQEKLSNFETPNSLELITPQLTPGSIMNKVIQDENTPFQVKIFKLSNGIEVFYKNTNFQEDKILLNIYKEEGSSTEDDIGYLNSNFLSTMIENSGVGNLTNAQYETFLKGKNFTINSYIGDYIHGMNLESDSKNFDIALKSLTSFLLVHRFDDNFFNKTKETVAQSINNRNNSPSNIYRDSIANIISNNHFRRKSLSLKNLNEINKESILEVYKNKYSNFNGFKVIVVGSIEEKKLEEVILKYFSSLPSNENINKYKILNISSPTVDISKSVVKGKDEKATITIVYPYTNNYSNIDRNLFKAFSTLLNVYLIEDIREKLSGVYSIYSQSNLEYINHGENNLIIRFSCVPNRVEEIIKATKTVVNNLSIGNYDEKKLLNIIENYKLTYETELRNNNFWNLYIYKKSLQNNDYSVLSPKEYKELITYENLLKFSKKNITNHNSLEIILKPE
ncbi:MAG: M16 family metallopeptidase [Fusobacteriaceae bacterium]